MPSATRRRQTLGITAADREPEGCLAWGAVLNAPEAPRPAGSSAKRGLDDGPDWGEVAAQVGRSCRLVAPKRLAVPAG